MPDMVMQGCGIGTALIGGLGALLGLALHARSCLSGSQLVVFVGDHRAHRPAHSR